MRRKRSASLPAWVWVKISLRPSAIFVAIAICSVLPQPAAATMLPELMVAASFAMSVSPIIMHRSIASISRLSSPMAYSKFYLDMVQLFRPTFSPLVISLNQGLCLFFAAIPKARRKAGLSRDDGSARSMILDKQSFSQALLMLALTLSNPTYSSANPMSPMTVSHGTSRKNRSSVEQSIWPLRRLSLFLSLTV